MSKEELDAFLADSRTCRVATLTSSGAPHVSPLWYVWDGTSLWLYSIVKSQRWADIVRDPRVAVVVDAGHEFFELHGVELRGTLEQVGEAPRTGAESIPELEAAEKLFAVKYFGSADDGPMHHDGRHGWVKLTPTKIASWDHRKIADL
ncbi:pyridoxamine 5'-phosphate oxidase family protein [Cryptosporangium phraense]|uniref:Pyridoxamine 5'-phosphate oxidase family protein n=1 Tax=Cryptosporangium phraense TaxID=2593070 RepID=A0A545B0P6_9ACTN|nr:pyridoxamine 5'-phosphate oxidase family protein [Cryptosporangium phraense]